MGGGLRVTSGSAIERPGDLAAILTNLNAGDILFIDEIHRLGRTVEEVLYSAMEDFAIDVVIGKGPSARSIRLDLPKFTLIGATTRAGSLSSPLRDRFGATYRLDFYEEADIQKILERSARILKVDLPLAQSNIIAAASRRTPRTANRLLKRVRDFAQVHNGGIISEDIIRRALSLMGVEANGLDSVDKKILKGIIERFHGGPVGVSALSAAIAEEKQTIEEVYEPYLLQAGFINRTAQGRVATEAAYYHLNLVPPPPIQAPAPLFK
jgi:Holliday junction DNA helicase RuvB